MADAPRDPRQLARDILSGKISIEDLAREQRKRAEAQKGGTPAGAGNLAPKVPLPRPVQAKPVTPRAVPPVQRAIAKPPAVTVRPVQRPPIAPQRVVARPGPTSGAARTPLQVPSKPVLSAPAAAAMPVEQRKPTVAAYQQAKPAGRDVQVGGVGGIRALVQDRAAMRRAVVLSEILGKPLSLRGE